MLLELTALTVLHLAERGQGCGGREEVQGSALIVIGPGAGTVDQ
jgi:hypothetical protein